MLSNFFRFDTIENSAQTGSRLSGAICVTASLAFFIALDRSIAAQHDASDGTARGFFAFIGAPIITYYAFQYGQTFGLMAGAAGRAVYEDIQFFRQSNLSVERVVLEGAQLTHRVFSNISHNR